jgi:putative membrane protein
MSGIILRSSFLALLGAVTLAMPVPAGAQEEIGNVQELVDKLHLLNQEEIQVGKLAQSKGQSNPVKEFAQHLVGDHQQADQKVKEFAQKKQMQWKDNVELPAEKKQAMEKLSSAGGRQFDTAFLREMEAGHQKAITMVKGASENLKDSEAKEFAASLLPTLQQHLDQAKKLLQQQTSE